MYITSGESMGKETMIIGLRGLGNTLRAAHILLAYYEWRLQSTMSDIHYTIIL